MVISSSAVVNSACYSTFADKSRVCKLFELVEYLHSPSLTLRSAALRIG